VTPRTVILDFYGTLAETPDWGPSWDDVLAELGYTLPDDVRERWWHDGIDGTEHDEHSVSRDHYVAWQQSRLRNMLTDCSVSSRDQDRFIERVREISGHRHIRAFAEVHTTLAALRERGLVLAICSNWDWDLDEAVESAGLADTVDVLISSAWVGARKPHPRIYAHTLERLGVDADDAVFVGDTWSCDVDGPRAAGIRAVYLRRTHLGPDMTRPADYESQNDVARATRLDALLDVVS
jgi:putative hydrolase of the HAD superfamily